MRIIALRGTANCGKSQTLNIAYQFLLQRGFLQVPEIFRVLGNPIQRDFMDVLENESLRVGFVTMGDFARGVDSLRNLLREVAGHQCHVIICACNDDKQGTVNAVAEYPNHIFVGKSPIGNVSEERIINNRDANRILAEL